MANGVALNIVNWVGVGLSTVVFIVRAYTRVFIARSIGLDDLFMLLSLLASYAAAGLITAAVHYGLGGEGIPSLLASKYSFLSGIPVLIAQSFAWDASTDLILALLPALILSTMNMKLRLKVGLICLMGLGVFTSIATIIKAVEFATLYQKTGGSNYAQATIFIWTVIQVYVVIIAASLPYCRAVFSYKHREATEDAHKPAAHGRINLKHKRPKHLEGSSQQNFIPLSDQQSHD
ncbi:hypothetical protein FHL15_001229 [Xylaria flabelliformis]|uniref:Rhodopsin domain-containing protein n=1 Tax=Xylaria flabelliformis TaxID=2512241 RepID=A0A553ICV6_9PEZI|nr:hypothetical protein FHL15_001229 [Xylaria flabelliformis]